jgi:hypothetical protein
MIKAEVEKVTSIEVIYEFIVDSKTETQVATSDCWCAVRCRTAEKTK